MCRQLDPGECRNVQSIRDAGRGFNTHGFLYRQFFRLTREREAGVAAFAGAKQVYDDRFQRHRLLDDHARQQHFMVLPRQLLQSLALLPFFHREHNCVCKLSIAN